MTTESELLRQILDAPEDDAPRRAYGRLLAERGDPRGEFIQVQLDIARIYRGPRTRESKQQKARLTPRQRALLAAHEKAWAAPIAAFVKGCTFARGFVEGITIEATEFPSKGEALYRLAPILHLDLVSPVGALDAVCASPLLDRIVSIDLFNKGVGDEEAKALAASQHLRRLAWLNLGHNHIGMPGLEALVTSPNLPSLEYVNFAANRAPSPCDKPGGVDGDFIMDWDATDTGEELEKRFGEKKWFHYHDDDTSFWPPQPGAFVKGS